MRGYDGTVKARNVIAYTCVVSLVCYKPFHRLPMILAEASQAFLAKHPYTVYKSHRSLGLYCSHHGHTLCGTDLGGAAIFSLNRTSRAVFSLTYKYLVVHRST